MLSTAVCLWLFLLLSLSSWKTTDSKEMRVVCYYTNWSVYRPGEAKFTPQNINPYLCTHLIYAFGGFTKENTLKPFDKYQDIEKGGYAKFTGLKTYNKNLKTMLAIGGWNEGSTRFSPLVANAERRKELVKNSIKFLRQNHFDGLDLDWEYPAFRDGGKPRDKENYALFVKELREEFERESQKTGRPRLLLTMAVPAGIEYVNKGYDVPKLTKYLDWMNILSYDYHSAFEPAVNHHAPLYPLEEDNEYNYDAELNIDYTIKHYLKLGADPSKLVLGIPTYGRSYTLYNPDAFEMGSPADGPGTMGEATRENGYLAYYEVCDYIKNQEWDVEEENPTAMGPYAFKDDQWVGYDDESIVRKKAEYVAEKKLGGIMFWAIDNDDFRGNCHGKPYPLIEAGKEALLNAYGITDENLITPPAKPIKPRTRTRTKTLKNVSTEEKDTKTEKVTTSILNRRRSRVKPKVPEVKEEVTETSKSTRKIRRKSSTTTEEPTYSSLKVATPSYTTPAPPSTPDMQGAFKCEDEGFYPHPKDCKKYFWCLSGAGDSGIVAHQFTCPAGLYFNKAADSCDYSQNVLCNKKLQRATTSSASTTEASTQSSTVSTSTAPSTTRAPSRVFTTSKKALTTTTEAEYEYEYEDEDEEKDTTANKGEIKQDEEDPQVIKDLIELIRKAGGIEELEKQLKVKNSNIAVSTGDATTETTIGKSLYERLFNKALKNTDSLKKNTYLNIRNSRGPQNEGIQEEKKAREKSDRGKLQYTSILRQRASTTESTKDEESADEEIDEESKLKNRKLYGKQTTQLEYVNIRRGRLSTTTEEPEPNNVISRNKVLGESTDEDEEEEEYEDEDADEEEKNDKVKSSFTPQYVNIRRQRPSTTEVPSTSKYLEIRRGTTPGSVQIEEDEKEETDSKYKTIRRGSTSPSTTAAAETTTSVHIRRGTSTAIPNGSTEDTSKKYFHIRRPTTERILTTESSKLGSIAEKGEITTLFVSPNVELKATPSIIIDSTESTLFVSKNENISNITNDSVNSDSETISRTSSTESLSSDVTTEVDLNQSEQTTSERISTSTGSTRRPSITESTTQTSKVSQFNSKFRLRSKTESSKNESVSSNDSTPKSTQFLRVRGSSRFKVNQSDDSQESGEDIEKQFSIQSKRKFVSTTEKSIDDNRNYRPAELADLSSLTAVDFEKVKEINAERQLHRRRRPLRPAGSSTTALPKELDGGLKTGPRTLPLARKLISTSSFGKSRRITERNEQDSTLVGGVSESNSRGTRTTREPSSIATATETYNITTSTIGNPTPRSRRIIRKFRTTTTAPTVANVATEYSQRKVFSSINRNQSKPVKQRLFNQKAPQLYALQENRDEEVDDSFEDNSNDEEENIKLSESNIREHSDINSFNSNAKKGKLANEKGGNIHEKSTFGNKFESKTITNLKRDKTLNSEDQPITESNVTGRTRKIIRKLTATESTTIHSGTEADQHFGRKRKVIRRLRPVITLNATDHEDSPQRNGNDTVSNNNNEEGDTTRQFTKHLYRPLLSKQNISESEETEDIKIRLLKPTLSSSQNESTLVDIHEHNETETYTNAKRIFRPKVFTERNNFIKSNTTVSLNDTDAVTNDNINFNGNKYINRGPSKYSLQSQVPQLSNNKSSVTIDNDTSVTTDLNEFDKDENGTEIGSVSVRNNVRKYIRNRNSNSKNQRDHLGRTRVFRPTQIKGVINEETESAKNRTILSTNLKTIQETIAELGDSSSNDENANANTTEIGSVTIKSNIKSYSRFGTKLDENPNVSDGKSSGQEGNLPDETTETRTRVGGVETYAKEDKATVTDQISYFNNNSKENIQNETESSLEQKVGQVHDINLHLISQSATETSTENDTIVQKELDKNKTFDDFQTDGQISGHYIVKQSGNNVNGENREYGQKRILRPSVTKPLRQNIQNQESRSKSFSRSRGSPRAGLIKESSQISRDETGTEVDIKNTDVTILEEISTNNSQILQANITKVENANIDVINYGVTSDLNREIDEGKGVELKDDGDGTENPQSIVEIENSFKTEELDEENVSISTTTSTTTTEATTKRNNNFRRPKDRPSFSRSKLTRVKTTEETSERISKYKTFSRSTSTVAPPSKNKNEVVNSKSTLNRSRFKAFSRYNPTTTENPDAEIRQTTQYSILATDGTSNVDSDNEVISYDISTAGILKDNLYESSATSEPTLNTDTESTPYITSTTEEFNDIMTTIKDGDNIEISTLPPMTDGEIDTETTTDLPLLSTIAYGNEVTTDRNINAKLDNNHISVNDSVQVERNDNSQKFSLETELTRQNITVQTTNAENTADSVSSRPKFIPSKLRNRPSFSKGRTRVSTSTTERGQTAEQESVSPTKKFGKYSNRYSTTERNSLSKVQGFRKGFTRKETTRSGLEKTSPLPLNKLLYRYSTTEKYRKEGDYDDYDAEEVNDEYEEYKEDEDNSENNENTETENKNLSSLVIKSTSIKGNNDSKQINRPQFAQKQSAKVVNSPVIKKISDTSKVGEELKDIDTEAIKSRNKNLFSKSKTVNTPFVGQITSDISTEVPKFSNQEENASVDSSTNSTQQETTTESLTTLHHVFADVSEDNLKTTTESFDIFGTVTSKIEKLVEVNRIVKVKTKEEHIKNHKVGEQKTDEAKPVLDKVGAVNRIAVINVVDTDGNTMKNIDSNENDIHQFIPKSPVYIPKPTEDIPIKESVDAIIEIAKVQEIPATPITNKVNLTNILVEINNSSLADPFKSYREDRKFEIYGGSKLYSYYAKDAYQLKPEIIDGISHINIITPRPIYNTESSTISLEGLFQTKKPDTLFETRYSPLNDELLDTENSKFVQVRVLHPDELNKLSKNSVRGGTKFIPYKHLKQDEEEVTMKARVVEVKPEPSADVIKIIPIKVEMSKRVTKTLPTEKQNTTPT